MHVVERGQGTPLVLIHGFSVDHRLLLPLDTAIDAAGQWRRLYFDLPGHGHTPAGSVTSAEDVVTAVKAEIHQRLGGDKFAILGNSFGGMIARRVAHDCRDRILGLATVAGVFRARHEERNVPARTVLREDVQVLRELGNLATDYAEMAVVQTRENAKAFLDYAQPGLAAADQRALERIAANYSFDNEPEEVSPHPFTQPSLFITGRQDQVVGYRDAWVQIEHYPRATFVTLDSAGHNVHLDRMPVAEALITDWLERVAEQTRA